MSTENKKPTDNFIFKSYKEDKSSKRKSIALDIIFMLLLAAMCTLLMSLTIPETKFGETKSQEVQTEFSKSVSEIKSNLLSKNKGVFQTDFSNVIITKKNQAIVN